ncbi:inverse autotransporter beta domain-containing protein [Verrucomicrobium spinosum]|uniref:inverse autotransporter beta domain-containing protein n=1 Tax=Verrucomicrobium spinosum TaxID=2736 RepID=UPI0012F6ADD7|nr:inverse autotransporter beta domain-containing protein [Verrucomicrobium spinosum]
MKPQFTTPLLLKSLVGAVLALSLSGTGIQAGPPDAKGAATIEPSGHPMYLGTVTAGLKTSDAYTDGHFSIVAPLYSTLGADATLEGSVLFIEPYVSYGEGGEIASSLGLGFRHLFGSQPLTALSANNTAQAGFLDEGVFVGSSVFVDMLDTEANNQFWQLGVGIEAGTRYVEVRGNYYIPLSDKQLAEETRTRETIRNSRSRSTSYLTGVSDPYATGNTIAQDAAFTTRTTTTTYTTTIERLFRRYEEGMEGWDAEVAVLVPGLDRYLDVRVIGGYYSFDNQPFGPQQGGTGNVEGWKAGLELRPVPAVILTGTWYEDARLTGSDWTVGVQLQIPFEAGDLGDGKNFLSRVGDAFKPRRRHLAERMAEPVRRQNAAVKLASTVESSSRSQTTRNTDTSTSQSTKMIVLTDDVVFVNNGDAVGNGIQAGDTSGNGANGTAERPYNSLVDGANTASIRSNASGQIWKVYTQGDTDLPYTGSVIVTGSTDFISSFEVVTGMNGLTFGGNTGRPELTGLIDVQNVAHFGIRGYEVTNSSKGSALFVSEVAEFTASKNVFTASDIGIHVENDAIEMAAEIRENQFNGASTAIKLDVHTTGDLTAEIDRNEFSGSFQDGLYGYNSGNSNLVVLLTNNDFSGSYVSSLGAFENGGTSNLDVTITGNTAAAAATLSDDGFQFKSSGTATNTLLVEGNEFLGTSGDSLVEINTADSSTFTATIHDNTFDGVVDGQAVDLISNGTSSLTAYVTENLFDGEMEQALNVDKLGSSKLNLTFNDNTLAASFSDDALSIASNGDGVGSSLLKALVQGNTFSGTFDLDGIDADQVAQGPIELTLKENIFSGTFTESAIDLTGADSTGTSVLMTAFIEDNDFSGSYSSGNSAGAVHIIANSAAKISATLSGNEFSGTYSTDVVSLRSSSTSQLTVTVADNTLLLGSTVTDAFLDVQSSDTSTMTITGLDRNAVNGTVVRGFSLREQGSSIMTVNGTLDPAANNTVTTGTATQTTGTPTGSFQLNGSQKNL